MPTRTPPLTKQQWLITVEGIKSYWETFSGLESSAQSSEYSDGLSYNLQKIVGARQIADVTIQKVFVPPDDWAIYDWFQNWCTTGEGVVLTLQPVRYCPRPEPYGRALILEGCKPMRFRGFELDKKSQDPTTVEITFAVNDAKVR